MSTKNTYFPAQKMAVLSGGELIGDALMKLPYLRALRAVWPKTEIHWVTTFRASALCADLKETTAPLVDSFDIQPSWMETKNGQAPAFDLVIDTRGRWKYAVKSRTLLPHQLFIAPAFRFLFSDRRPSLFQAKPSHLQDRLFQTIELAAGYRPEVPLGLPIPAELKAKARRVLPEGQIYVGFAPGAGGDAKKWPIENFEKIAQLQARMDRIPVFLLGPQELDLYDRLFRSVPEAIFPLQAHEVWGTDKISVDQTLAIASCLALAVTNDSGTSHMLAAVNCPMVSLFGPTSAEKIAPRVTFRETLTAQDFGSPNMAAITIESVQEAVNKLILLQGKA